MSGPILIQAYFNAGVANLRNRAAGEAHCVAGPSSLIGASNFFELAEGRSMSIVIYHNPACGTSRNTLAMIRQSGEEPEVIEYLKTPPSREKLKELIAAMGIPVRAVLREKGTPHHDLGLGDPKWTDDELIDFMLAHPILINRPIVVTPKGVRLCRPSEVVLEILPNPNIGVFTKEDGEVVKG